MLSSFENLFKVMLQWIKSLPRKRGNKPPTEKELREQTLRRITLVLSLLKPVSGKPQARLFKVKNKADIHRFMLLLCDAEYLHYRTVGGLMRSDIQLPNNAGVLMLREKTVDNFHRTLAVLRLNTPFIATPIDEVIFRIK